MNIMFYVIITGILVSITVFGVWRRYHRNNDNDLIGILDESYSYESDREDLAIL